MIQTLIKSNSFASRYVAMKDFTDSTVISEGNTPTEAYNKAIKKGYKNPVVTFVPTKDMVQIY